MVSFQCHGCGDVVKKPKLDQHRSRCFTGFDCIDCSKSFNAPADYRGHTSCISEAEKYQKGLYKGPRTGPNEQKSTNSTPQSNSATKARQSNAQWSRNPQLTSSDNVNGYPYQNGRQNDRDNRGRGVRNSSSQQSRSPAGGANNIPLGMLRRSSLRNQTGQNGVVENGVASGVGQVNPRAVEAKSKDKPRKEKRKRKAENTDNCSSQTGKEKSLKASGATAEETPVAVNIDANQVVDDGRKTKKRKMKVVDTQTGPETGSAEVKAKVKRRKKDKQGSGGVDAGGFEDKKEMEENLRNEANSESNSAGADNILSGDKKRTKRKRKDKEGKDEGTTTVAKDVGGSEQTTKPKRRKKTATTDVIAGDSATPIVDNQAVVMSVPETKKKRKRATANTDAREEKKVVQGDMGIELGVNDDKKKRKRKRHDESNDDTKKKRRKHNADSRTES